MRSLFVLLLVSLMMASSMAQVGYGFFCARKGERCGSEGQACCLTSGDTNKPLFCSALWKVCKEMDDSTGPVCSKEGESCRDKECCSGLLGNGLQCNILKRCVKSGTTCAAKGESCSNKDCCTSIFTPLKCNSLIKRCVESTCKKDGESCQDNDDCCNSIFGRLTCETQTIFGNKQCKECAKVDESCETRQCCSGNVCGYNSGRRMCRARD